MAIATEPTLSLWQDRSPTTPETALTESLRADVCVIGGGIAGLTTAYLLAKEGRGVVVLDQATPGGGETGRTTAHLASAIDDRYLSLLRRVGREKALLASESHRAAIDFIEEISRSENIDCGFRRVDGYLFAGEGRSARSLERELEAARECGQPVDWADSPGGLAFLGRCLRFPRQGQFSPLDYLRGLREAIARFGGRIYSNTRVLEIEEDEHPVVRTDREAIVRAPHVIVAANTPFNDRVTMHTKLFPYQTYAIAATVPAGSVPEALYWDDLDPYHYVRLTAATPGYETLIIGGEDHKTGQQPHPNPAFENLERWARERFPGLGTVTHQWSGEVLETLDGLAYIGRNPGSRANVWIATGDSGMGMTHGTIAGIVLSDLVIGRENPWAPAYDPSRAPAGGVGDWTKENLNVARQYLDWAKPSGSAEKEPASLRPGEGCVFQRGLHKVAIHRDSDGTLHERSAVCPHLGCIVEWNETEHTWDCPCHGSRFLARGEVIHGPSPTNLASVPPA
jgi:glycine/D-amino acid oxidase-like deaminating enzyme/nitrite reductase/ring-hydroxylating ferredoxin subunit